jgi:pantoate--beta-alanine ligase
MGFLHEGHLSLVRRAREDNASVVVSIFVNPTQFGPNEDLQSYPRDMPRDLSLLQQAGVDAVFAPEPAEMYPPGFNTWVTVEGITSRLEGATRPGHFRGVATVCHKLFSITQPGRAYFGQKDAQQVLVIRKMVRDLNMNLKIVASPTVREVDGLAMSSRNTYLNPDERQSATVLYRALKLAEELWQNGKISASEIRRRMAELINNEPSAAIDYISIADGNTLEELETAKASALVSLAVRIGRTRLIDNIILP